MLISDALLCLQLLVHPVGGVGETFATCILAYLAYLMRESSKIREVKKEKKRQFYKHSTRYVLGLLLLFDIFIVSYDFGTGTYKHTLLLDGHCSYFVQKEYNTFKNIRHL